MHSIPARLTLHTLPVALLLSTCAAHASGINGISGAMPNRISMNVTVPRQTQGTTFGEKVNAGLHAAGGVIANGAIVVECGAAACAVVFPDGSGTRADLASLSFSPLPPQQSSAVKLGPAGASVVGGAIPGGGIVSAALSTVTRAATGEGRASADASVADGATFATRVTAPGEIDVVDPLPDAHYVLTVVVERATPGLRDVVRTQVRGMPPRVRIDFAFDVEGGVLKARHDVAMNSIRNMR